MQPLAYNNENRAHALQRGCFKKGLNPYKGFANMTAVQVKFRLGFGEEPRLMLFRLQRLFRIFLPDYLSLINT